MVNTAGRCYGTTWRGTGRMTAAPELYIRLYGTLELLQEDRALPRPGPKLSALIAYLALFHDRAHDRGRLAGLIWPEVDDERARHCLRQTPLDLRKRLSLIAPHALVVDDRTVMLRTDGLSIDTSLVDKLLTAPDGQAILTALELTEHELLESSDEEWATSERRSRDRALREAAIQVIEDLAGESSGSDALDICDRVLRRDPADEEVHRLKLRLYATQGDWPGLIRQFRTCETTLQSELDVTPSRETTQLYEELRSGIKAHAHSANQSRDGPSAPGERTKTTLPAQTTRFIGRSADISEARDLLLREDVRLVTLTSPALRAGG